ncbi:putative membrane protein [Oopsacas minuta]|uniref:Membrane protein n=1 Tax=Oopsacas minuta TaxID=111878 RepID=A0AAV7JHT2_9METZ|nr:putative membrane protein [Oopsacas minuta]
MDNDDLVVSQDEYSPRGSSFGAINSDSLYQQDDTEGNEEKLSKPQEQSYSRIFAFVYILNLIVGVGAIAMPKAIALAGWLLGLVLLIVLALLSYMTATYVIEAMATANAYGKSKEKPEDRNMKTMTISRQLFSSATLIEQSSELQSPLIQSSLTLTECVPSPSAYTINKRFELGDMANLFFNKLGIVLYYIAIILYLYGDMAIYLVTVPKSLVNVTCIIPHFVNSTLSIKECYGFLLPIWLYRIYLVIFIVLLGPFLFFNLSKSKWLQLITAIMRNVAFVMMILIALVYIARGNYHIATVANIAYLPNLFGVIIYAFMCQHSLPGMITPLKRKKGVNLLILFDYISVLLYYAALSFSAVFRFSPSEMEDVYTLNFFNIGFDPVSYYLALFPVFTLSTNFPIIGITLRENLKSLYGYFKCLIPSLVARFPIFDHWFIDKVIFPFLAMVPPFIIAFFTMDVELLVGITGSYAGVCVQYLIPVALVFASRRVIIRERGEYKNPHKSPFSHWIFLIGVVIWSVICLILVTIDRLDFYFHFLEPSYNRTS